MDGTAGAGGAEVDGTRRPQLGHFRAAERVVAHLSDTHLLADGAPLYETVDTSARLAQAVERLIEHGGRLDAIVVTGDVADRGEEDAYLRVRAQLDPLGSGSAARSCG